MLDVQKCNVDAGAETYVFSYYLDFITSAHYLLLVNFEDPILRC